MFRLTILLLFASMVFAQDPEANPPVIGPYGVLHGATFQPVVAPYRYASLNGIAPGSIFVLQGAYLGPDELVIGTGPYGLRLPDMPGGTEVHVRSIATGELFQSQIVHAWSFQVAAILPSDFPIGEAELEVRYQGQASEPVEFPVVRTFPGLFSASQHGSGRGIIQNYESPSQTPLNGLTHPARPGQYIILWATGLGDAAPEEVEVTIEGHSYPVAYAGPAPGMPGVDQINVRLPEDMLTRGCYLRLGVVAGGVSSGTVSFALSDDGNPCQHPWGLTPERMAEIEAGARATYVRLSLSDGFSDVEEPAVIPTRHGSSVVGQASTLNEAGLEGAVRAYGFGVNNIIPTSRLSCPGGSGAWISVGAFFPYPGSGDPIPSPPTPPNPPRQGADAGSTWLLSGPSGQTLELPAPEPNPFGTPDATIVSRLEQPGFLAPGKWKLSTPGGADIIPFETAVSMPVVPEVSGPDVIRREEAFEVRWRPEDLPAAVEAQVGIHFRQPANTEHPEGRTSFGFGCRVANPTGSVLINLADLLDDLEGIEQAELTFRVTARGPEVQIPGVDRVETEASAFRTWSVPLE